MTLPLKILKSLAKALFMHKILPFFERKYSYQIKPCEIETPWFNISKNIENRKEGVLLKEKVLIKQRIIHVDDI